MALSKRESDVLIDAIGHLAALTDPTDQSKCAVDPEHKRAVRPYVMSWVLPQLIAVLASHSGNKAVERIARADVKFWAERPDGRYVEIGLAAMIESYESYFD